MRIKNKFMRIEDFKFMDLVVNYIIDQGCAVSEREITVMIVEPYQDIFEQVETKNLLLGLIESDVLEMNLDGEYCITTKGYYFKELGEYFIQKAENERLDSFEGKLLKVNQQFTDEIKSMRRTSKTIFIFLILMFLVLGLIFFLLK